MTTSSGRFIKAEDTKRVRELLNCGRSEPSLGQLVSFAVWFAEPGAFNDGLCPGQSLVLLLRYANQRTINDGLCPGREGCEATPTAGSDDDLSCMLFSLSLSASYLLYHMFECTCGHFRPDPSGAADDCNVSHSMSSLQVYTYVNSPCEFT